MGKVLKSFVKVTVAAATIGGLCYAFKDKIKESKVYKDHDMDNKISKVKTTIKEKMPKAFESEKDYVEDDEIFFDDLDSDATGRDYVSIDPDSSDNTDCATETDDQTDSGTEPETGSAPSEAETETGTETETADVPTIEI